MLGMRVRRAATLATVEKGFPNASLVELAI